MLKQSLWSSYLDEPAMLEWYPLPESVQGELASYQPDPTELNAMAPERFVTIHRDYVAYANQSVTNLPYHGPRHFEAVEQHGNEAVKVYEHLTGRTVPRAVKQVLALALRLHDCHHTGSTFRADAPSPVLLHRPELGTRVATEWVSTLALNELGVAHGLPLPWRLFQLMVVWSSTYGGRSPRGRELGIPDVQPHGLWGRLMRVADVCPPVDFLEWMAGCLAVNYGEVPASPAPQSWDGLLQGQLGFSVYVEHCFNQLDEAAGVPLTRELGWRHTLAGLRRELEEVMGGWRPATEQKLREMVAARHLPWA